MFDSELEDRRPERPGRIDPEQLAAARSIAADFPEMTGDLTVEDLLDLWAEHPAPTGLAYLDTIEPGPILAATLATLDPRSLVGHDRVFLLKAHARQAAHHNAQLLDVVASIGDVFESEMPDDLELAVRATSSEVRAALRLTRRSADTLYELADTLGRRLPALWDALNRGSLDLRRAQVIAEAVIHLPIEEAETVTGRVLESASELTTGQLRYRLRQLCMEISPEDAANRYEAGVEDRAVTLYASEDGTASIQASGLPATRARAGMSRVDRIAKRLRRSGDARTLDQLRSDVFLDLLEGTSDHEGTGGRLEIRVDLDTLVRLADHPGDLAGFGPVIADIARKTAEEMSSWDYTVTRNHMPISVGTTRRRPTTQITRAVRAARTTCVFPGCRMPASQCDLDHVKPWVESRETSADNLVPLCRHDHRLRHETGWTHHLEPDRTDWISPLGHRYSTTSDPP